MRKYLIELTSISKNGEHEAHQIEGSFENLEDAEKELEKLFWDHLYQKDFAIELLIAELDEGGDVVDAETLKGYYGVDAAKHLGFDLLYLMTPDSNDKLLIKETDYLEFYFKGKNTKLNELLKTARYIKGYTQKELAELIDVSQASIEKYDMGTVVPGSKVLFKLINALDIDTELINEALEN